VKVVDIFGCDTSIVVRYVMTESLKNPKLLHQALSSIRLPLSLSFRRTRSLSAIALRRQKRRSGKIELAAGLLTSHCPEFAPLCQVLAQQ